MPDTPCAALPHRLAARNARRVKLESHPRPQFVGLRRLSYLTGVPARWLCEQADAGKLPFLAIGRRRLFDPAAVAVALQTLTTQTPNGDSRG